MIALVIDMKHTRTFQLELGERKAEGKRTFGAVLSTETPVARRSYDGEFFEVLSHAKGAIDLSRAPFPLIESHDARTLPIGIVDNVRIVDGKLRGDVTFGTSQRAREISDDVEAGIIRNLSVGYSIEKVDEKVVGKQKTITAIRWTPHEVSAVAIGADANAGFGRSYAMDEDENTDDTATPNTPTTYTVEGTIRATPATPATADSEGDQRSAATLERERCAAIMRLATRQLGDEAPAFAARLVETGAAIAEARRQILERVAVRDTLHINSHRGVEAGGYEAVRGHRGLSDSWMTRGRVTAGVDSGNDFRAASVDALLIRSGVPLKKPHPAAADVSGSVLDLARTCVSRAGGTVRNGNNEALIKRAMSTSDFPLILADVMNKAVRNGYETEPASHRSWVRPQLVPDFRAQNRPILGSAPALERVNEGGEYTNGSLNEDSASYSVTKYGKIVTLTWETLVNDSLGAFLRIQPAMGQAARRIEADTVYNLFALNAGAGPTMQDAVALFHATHGNLGTVGAFSADLLGAARTLLRKQTALGGGYLSLAPRYMIIPVELEQKAETAIAAATRSITTVDDSTPQWIAGLELVVEPRLAATAFYLAADSSQIDTCELGMLADNGGGPSIEEDRSEAFRRDVFSWKVQHVIGAKFLDWRGIVKQPVS